jgi:hypothetical protein
MKHSVIKHKTILGIDSNVDFLEDLKKIILNEYPECWFDKDTSFSQGRQYMAMFSYDLVISNIMSSPGADLVGVAESHDLPVLALLSNGDSLEALNHSNGLRIRKVLNKQNIEDLVPAIEHVLKFESTPGWKRALIKSGRHLKSFVSWSLPKNLRSDIPPCETFFY